MKLNNEATIYDNTKEAIGLIKRMQVYFLICLNV